MATTGAAAGVSTRLGEELAARIRRDGPLPFEEFMDGCLYHPQYGYYAAADRAIGRRGDFFTSVSVGPVFGELVAAWLWESWEAMGRPARVRLVEQGAHDGELMADVLTALERDHAALHQAAEPVIVEPLATRRERQRARLTGGRSASTPRTGEARHRSEVRWVESLKKLAEAEPQPTLFFANELLDALPVARWRFDGNRWHRLWVGLEADGRFSWEENPASEELARGDSASGIRLPGAGISPPPPWPAGYVTETCPGLDGWVAAVTRAVGAGRVLLFDYGREADDYFAPHRTAGTLRAYRHHRCCDDPLTAPGTIDLTADVNFTHLAEATQSMGWTMRAPERQGSFLTRLATRRLQSAPVPTPSWRRQFLTLTHPHHLGHQFHAIVLESPRGTPTPLAPTP